MDGGQSGWRQERWSNLLAGRQRGEAEGSARIAPQQGEIPSAAGEGRRGGGCRRGSDLWERGPRPGGERHGGASRGLEKERVELARTVGEVRDEAGPDGVRGLALQGAEVPHHFPDTLPKAQGPIVDRQSSGVKVSCKKTAFQQSESRQRSHRRTKAALTFSSHGVKQLEVIHCHLQDLCLFQLGGTLIMAAEPCSSHGRKLLIPLSLSSDLWSTCSQWSFITMLFTAKI